MKCPHCGADVTGDTCEFCGQKVIVKDQGSTANHTAAGGYAGYDPNNPGAWTPSGPPPEKWYEKTWVIILFLIFLWPIGLFLMWRYKKNWGKVAKIVITVVVALCVLYSCTSPDKPDTDKTAVPKTTTVKDTAKSEPKKDERKEEIVKEHYEIDLSAGNYTAGKDIPIGTYNITATSGTGNVSSSNMFSGGLNEVMSPDDDGISQQSFNGLKMKKDVVLTVGGDVVIHLIAEDAQTGTVAARGEASGSPIDLPAGNYTAGTEFPAGIYTVIATGGTGNVSSSNMFDGGLNEVMGQEGFGVTQFNNAVFTEGVTLTVSGTSIQLVPVGE